ncbi:hypothetical protein GOB85_07640 [Acetobacter sp. LMG 1636]|uniref:Transposase n=1 Tax=Acetobacter fallax TaxID=1737473 RepID=A0ABX0KB79_9PROT|nr:hypothetical protein [Acetobacter fallax]NHO35993.1 hypothetical protein [Acetobacter fallax]
MAMSGIKNRNRLVAQACGQHMARVRIYGTTMSECVGYRIIPFGHSRPDCRYVALIAHRQANRNSMLVRTEETRPTGQPVSDLFFSFASTEYAEDVLSWPCVRKKSGRPQGPHANSGVA